MTHSRKKLDSGWMVCALTFALLTLLSAGVVGTTEGASGQTVPPPTVVAAGLNNPRGLTFGPDAALYVAEAGTGGDGACIIGPAGEVCYGATGSITRIANGTQARIVSDLPSLAMPDSGAEATGPHDVTFDADGNLYTVTGLGANPAVRADDGPLGAHGANFGQLISVTVSGAWTSTVDVAAFEAAVNPDDNVVDSNPFSLVADTGDGFVVSDAGANALLQIAATGEITTLAVFPTRTVEFPPGSGSTTEMQAVPTGLVRGPDDAYYVGQLTGFPFPVGGANVYRVVAGAEPVIYASGFTNVIDIAFDADGNLYVLEIDANSLAVDGADGAVTRITPFGLREALITSGLVLPTGMAIDANGDLYISNRGPIGAGVGQVLQYSVPPPHYTIHIPLTPKEGAPAAK